MSTQYPARYKPSYSSGVYGAYTMASDNEEIPLIITKQSNYPIMPIVPGPAFKIPVIISNFCAHNILPISYNLTDIADLPTINKKKIVQMTHRHNKVSTAIAELSEELPFSTATNVTVAKNIIIDLIKDELTANLENDINDNDDDGDDKYDKIEQDIKEKDEEINELKTRNEEQRKTIEDIQQKLSKMEEKLKTTNEEKQKVMNDEKKDKKTKTKKTGGNKKDDGKSGDLKEWMTENACFDKKLYSALSSDGIMSVKKVSNLNQNDFDKILRKYRVAQFAKLKDQKSKDKVDKLLIKFEKGWRKSKKKKKNKKK